MKAFRWLFGERFSSFPTLKVETYLKDCPSEVGGVSEPGNLNGSYVRDPFAGALDFD